MGKKHFFLYDFALPVSAILLIGRFLAGRFNGVLFHRADSIKAFGIGFWFAHSELRAALWDWSWLIFALIPAAAWLVWVRINLEYDSVAQARRLDRPIFKFFRSLDRWIEGDEAKGTHMVPEGRLAQAQERIRRLEAELAAQRAKAREEWPDEIMPPARARQR